ncbi:MAG: hypothetical protein DA405_12830 [Bacteroidetes bacterium]|nr:MAG: hypothetical protein DA405_12830 [Bacteroidota bacterium]
MKKSKSLALALTLLSDTTSFAQSFSAEISAIKETGLYKILLPAQLRAASAQNFDFLRLNDTANLEQPYLIMDASDRQFATYQSIEILDQKIYADSLSRYIINRPLELTSSLILKLANTEIDKEISIYGSDNKEDWFGLIENQRLNINASSSPLIEKSVSLPLSNYAYLKIEIDNRTSAPIDLKEFGFYTNQYIPSALLPLQEISWELKELTEEKITRINFSSLDVHQIDALAFEINNAYYLRPASLLEKREQETKKGREIYEEVLYRFNLSASSQNYFTFTHLALAEFHIDIENADNPPLEIANIHFYQKPKYLVAYLEAGKSYHVDIDLSRKRPQYDLGNFISDKLHSLKDAEIISMNALKSEANLEAKADVEDSFFQSKLFMWLAILIGGLLISYIAFGLLKDMGKE